MRAMVLTQIAKLEANPTPLSLVHLPDPVPSAGQVIIKVSTCGVCHTELDEIEGRAAPTRLPMVLGHQVVGQVVDHHKSATLYKPGQRLGVAWIYSACGECIYCRSGLENLCPQFEATGRDAFGGYAEYMAVPQAFAYPIPDNLTDSAAAPLLCAGAIGYRSLRLAEIQDGQALGLAGFGASAHLVLKMMRHKFPASPVYVFARSPDERAFALDLGAAWAGSHADSSPVKLHSIIDTTPVWGPVVEALKNLQPGGRLVINAIRKESHDQQALLDLDYPRDLWLEKEIKSVANVTRRDVVEFLQLAAEIPIQPEVQEYPLEQANLALSELKHRKIRGAKVLRIR